MNTPLKTGKLPNELLSEIFDQADFKDPSVFIGPAVGQDTAAVFNDKADFIILASDPITFTAENIAKYAVTVNANDIAVSGTAPKWFLASLLFPAGTQAAEISSVINQLKENCRSIGITLCGGHTEITDAVKRPIVSGTMIGTVSKSRLIDKKNIRAGDLVFLTKSIAVEGSAIISSDFENILKQNGMSLAEIQKCRDFVSDISILPEAQTAAQISGVSAMHDITEGGIGTALSELSIAGGCKIEVNIEKIPIFPETLKICRILGLNPFGLIGSGSLLICCAEKTANKLIEKVQKAEIQITCIGKVVEKGQGIEAFENGFKTEWKIFARDEITKLYGE